jgi:hypothetical protein
MNYYNNISNFEITYALIQNPIGKIQMYITDFKLWKIPKVLYLGKNAFVKVYLGQ